MHCKLILVRNSVRRGVCENILLELKKKYICMSTLVRNTNQYLLIHKEANFNFKLHLTR